MMSHKFEGDTRSPFCQRCDLTASDPVHSVNEDELPGMWESADFVDNKPEQSDNRADLPPDLEEKLDEYVEANNLVLLLEMHEQMHRDELPSVSALNEAALPYAGTSGWSGSETSRATAVDEDNDGRTLDKQQRTLTILDYEHRVHGDERYVGRSFGYTWRELDGATGWGHGSTSRVLSDLHKAGLLARLSEVRNRCKVYVLPKYVAGRETEPHGGRGGARLTDEERARVRQAADEAEVNYHGLEVTELLTDLLNIIDRLAPELKSDG